MDEREIFNRINQLRDQLDDLRELRYRMDCWGFNTDEITTQEDYNHNQIMKLYEQLDGGQR